MSSHCDPTTEGASSQYCDSLPSQTSSDACATPSSNSLGIENLQTGSNTYKQYSSGTTIDDLPDEMVLEIFSYMSFTENVNIFQKVCARWKILAQDAKLWLDKEYVARHRITTEEEMVTTFRAVPQLRAVIFEDFVSTRVFEALSESCPNLTRLETASSQTLSYSDRENLFKRCKEIHTLRISCEGLQSDPRFLETLAWLPHLQVLYLKLCDVKNLQVPLHILADRCPKLNDLDMQWIDYKIQDAEYFIEAKKYKLKRLCIKCMSVEKRCIIPLLTSCADSLEYLDLNEDNVRYENGEEALRKLGKLHNLQSLSFGVEDERHQHLLPLAFESGRLSRLKHLFLHGYVLDEAIRAVVKGCPELQELRLWNCMEHTDTAFELLCLHKKLKILEISACRYLRRDAMRHIAKLPALESLSHTYINFKKLLPGLECILDMVQLRKLYLKGCNCFPIPFERFPGRLVNLRELNIDYCDGDQSVLDDISARMPELKIEGQLGALITSESD